MAIEDSSSKSSGNKTQQMEQSIQALERLTLALESNGAEEDFEYVSGQKLPMREDQVENSAGGFVFQVSDETRVRRFLIIGTTGGTYYVSESDLKKEAVADLIRIIEDGRGNLILQQIYEINLENRAPKREPSIYALALCARYTIRDWQKRRAEDSQLEKYFLTLQRCAFRLMLDLCRTPTDLFTFLKYAEEIAREHCETSGWGRMMRSSVCQWYFRRNPKYLALQLTKYKNRAGYTHRDALRLCHADPRSKCVANANSIFYDYLFHYAVSGKLDKRLEEDYAEDEVKELRESDVVKYMEAVQRVASLKAEENDDEECAKLIREQELVREHIPTDLLNSARVWEALLERMPIIALLRNLSKLSVLDLITGKKPENEKWVKRVVDGLADERNLRGIHPLSVLLAKSVYEAGRGIRGNLTFDTNPVILNALEEAFLKSFKNVKPTNNRYCIALDVSGSMSQHLPGTLLECYDAETALAMSAIRSEPHTEVVAFSAELTPLDVNAQTTFQQFHEKIHDLDFSSTDCAQPMLWAKKEKKQFDVFIVYTDNETYYGDVHPFEALRQYREASGIKDARLVVVAFTGTKFTIADPTDPLMLDVSGFDASTPELIANFVNGKV